MIALALSLLAFGPQTPEEVLKVNGPQPATIRLGDTSLLELIVEGRGAQPEMPRIPAVPGLEFRLSRPRPSTFTSFINGQLDVRHEVKFTVQIQPSEVGQFTIPPIRIYTGSKWQETPEMRLDVFKDLKGQEMGFLDIIPSATRVYVHEPVSFIADFGVDSGLTLARGITNRRTEYLDLHVQAPWLSALGAGEPMAVEDPVRPVPLVLNWTEQAAEYQPDFERDGRRFNRFMFEKAFLPNRPGRFELEAPLLVCTVDLDGPRNRRVGIFGERLSPGRVEQFFIYGEPLTLEVLPIPDAGRPVPFYGAVGRFEVSASLDRRQVRVGSSVKLTLAITGRGNFEFLRVPELDQISGFHLLGQTLNRERNQVEVLYDLTPLDASVTELPPISWNFFDTSPGVERFVELATDPIPLSVLPLEEAETLAPLAGTEDESVVPGVDDIFNIKAIDDGIGPFGTLPVVHPRVTSAVVAAVVGPWLLMGVLGLALRFHRRRRADVVGQRARSAARRLEGELKTGRDPGEALVAYLAARLGVAEAAVIGLDLSVRLEQAGVPESLAAETQAAVEGGVAGRYGGGHGLDQAAARNLVQRLETEARELKPQRGLALLLGTMLAAHSLSAQASPDLAYTRGDYAEAAAGYAELVQQANPDRRLYYNLGNALFRQGKLAEALWAYESARLALPRDAELLANISLVKTRLDLTNIEGEPFVDALVGLRNSLTSRERLFLCVLFNTLAAGFLLLAWRRRPLRATGFVLLFPALILAADVLWVEPNETPAGIVLEDRVALVSEPRTGLEPVLTLRSGVSVDVLGEGPAWTQVQVRGRGGYLPADAMRVVR